MVVRAHDAGHHEPALHRAYLRLRVPGRQPTANFVDQRALDSDIDAALHPRRLQLHGGEVLQDQHGAYS